MHANNKILDELLVIIDDDPSIRDSLSLLFSHIGYKIIIFESVEEFVCSPVYGERCCAIIDLNLNGLSGLEALQLFKKDDLPIRTILISAFGTIKSVREAFVNNAVDFIEKPYDPTVLMEVVRRAFNNLPASRNNQDLLTSREKEIHEMLIKGLHAKEIAKLLGISSRTVESHKAHIFEKLNVKSTLALLANAGGHSPAG